MNIKTLITIILILITTKINAVVIDKESRKQLLSIDNQYSRKVGQIEAWNNANPEYRGSCTATNLNRRFIITSAHCIINGKDNKPFDNIVYYPRRMNIEKRSPSRVYIKTGYLMKGYEIKGQKLHEREDKQEGEITTEMISEDLAILEAFSEMNGVYVGEEYGYYKHDSKTLKKNDRLKVTISSYPSDKDFGTLWNETCYLKKYYANIGFVNCDLVKGASGSSVIYQNKIIGIFSAESLEDKKNHVTLITPEMEKEINNVVIGEHHLNKMLKKVNFKTQSYQYFYFENKCNKPINGAIKIKELSGEWSTYLMNDIKPKNRSYSTIENLSDVYYYYARTIDNKKEWAGNDTFEYINNKEKKGFIKMEAKKYKTGDSYGDWYIELRCY